MKRKHLQSIVFFLLAWLCGIGNIQAQSSYYTLSNNNTVLTLYYDNNISSRDGQYFGRFVTQDYQKWKEYRETITTVVIDESFANNTNLESTAFWFYKCENLKNIIGMKNLKTDNVWEIHNMFQDCKSLIDIDLSGFNTSKVTDMSYLFSWCSNLTNLDLRNFDTSNVKSMNYMFTGCSNLTALDVSSFNTSNVLGMNCMFSSC